MRGLKLTGLILLASAIGQSQAFALTAHLNTGIPGQKIYFASTLKDWDPKAFPMTETSPGNYSIALEDPWLHELQYKFVVDGRWIPDPENTRQVPDQLGGFNSWMQVEGFTEDPLLELQPGVAPPQRQVLSLRDWTGQLRDITLIQPRQGLQRTVVIYFQDGADYLQLASAASLLANLSAQPGFPRLVGVFVPPRDRTEEYGLTETTERYRAFFIQTVVPAAEEALTLHPSREERLLVGDSLGGLISLDLALRRPDLFGNVASQSGAFLRDGGRILEDLRSYAGPELHLSLDIGTYEQDRFIEGNRQLQSLLAGRGWEHRYQEHPSIHDWISWRNELQTLVAWFFNRRHTSP